MWELILFFWTAQKTNCLYFHKPVLADVCKWNNEAGEDIFVCVHLTCTHMHLRHFLQECLLFAVYVTVWASRFVYVWPTWYKQKCMWKHCQHHFGHQRATASYKSLPWVTELRNLHSVCQSLINYRDIFVTLYLLICTCLYFSKMSAAAIYFPSVEPEQLLWPVFLWSSAWCAHMCVHVG